MLLDDILNYHTPEVPEASPVIDVTVETLEVSTETREEKKPAVSAEELLAPLTQPNIDVAAIIAQINAARAAAGVAVLNPEPIPTKAPKEPKASEPKDPKWVAAGLLAAETKRINAERKLQGLEPISKASKKPADPKWSEAGLKAAATRKANEERKAQGLAPLNAKAPAVNPVDTGANISKFRSVWLRPQAAEAAPTVDATRAQVVAA